MFDIIHKLYPYLISGVVASLIYILILINFSKKHVKNSFISGLIFFIWFMISAILWNLGRGAAGSEIFSLSINDRFMLGFIGSIIWFLFSFLIQKKSLDKAFVSTGIFIIYYIMAEIVYTILNDITI